MIPPNERPAMMVIETSTVPGFIPYFHKQIIRGNGNIYRERERVAMTMIKPSATEMEYFPYLNGVEEVWLIYGRR